MSEPLTWSKKFRWNQKGPDGKPLVWNGNAPQKIIHNTPHGMHTIPEKIGIINETISYMQNTDNATALTAKNFDVAPHVTRLQDKLKNFGDLSVAQKKLEVDAKNATAATQAAAYDAYNDTSGTIDAMMGLLGKGTNEAQKLQTIRSKVRQHTTSNPPAPAATSKP